MAVSSALLLERPRKNWFVKVSFFDFKAHVAHVEEKPRINRIEQIHMELRPTLMHNTYGIFTRANQDFHRSVFKRTSRTRKAFFCDDTNRIEQFPDSFNNFILIRKKFRSKKLHLETVAELVYRETGKTVCSTIHNTVSVRDIKQRRAFGKCGLENIFH